MGRPVREANNLRSLAHIALVTGDLASAEALVRRAIERHRGVVLELRSDQVVLWGALLHAGRRAEAQACIELLATECEAADDRRTEAYARVGASIQQGPDEAGAGLRRAEALGASPALLAIGRAWRAHLDGDEAAVEQILAAVGPTAPGEEEWVLRALLDRERAGPELRLVARYESVHLQRPGQPVLVVTGNAARLLTELVQLAAPAPWELVARQVWGTEIDEQSLRRRWDTTLSRLRQRLEAAGVRRTLVNTDHRGNVELVLGPGELAIDES